MFVLLSLFHVRIVPYVCALCSGFLWCYCPFGCTSPVCVVASQNLNAAHKLFRFRIIFFPSPCSSCGCCNSEPDPTYNTPERAQLFIQAQQPAPLPCCVALLFTPPHS